MGSVTNKGQRKVLIGSFFQVNDEDLREIGSVLSSGAKSVLPSELDFSSILCTDIVRAMKGPVEDEGRKGVHTGDRLLKPSTVFNTSAYSVVTVPYAR